MYVYVWVFVTYPCHARVEKLFKKIFFTAHTNARACNLGSITLQNSEHVYCAVRDTMYTSASFDNPADTIIKVLLRNEKFTRDRRMQIRGSPISGRNGSGYVRALPAVPVHRRRIEMPAPSVSTIADFTTARLSRSFAGRERMLRRASLRRITLVRWYLFN